VRKIRSSTGFNITLNETIAGGLPRPDGRIGCMVVIRPGANMVPDELLNHHYLRSFIDAGAVTLHDVDEPPPQPRNVSKFFPPADRADLPNPFAKAAQHVIEPAPTDISADPATEHERQTQ
jgi:hypothetical protein